MNEPTRRAWSRPELVVIVRSGPEEAVLTVCKTQVSGGIGVNNVNEGCRFYNGNCTQCGGGGLS